MTAASALEAIAVFLGLLDRFSKGDARATQKVKDILPASMFTRMVREREKALDRKKFGGG